MRFTETPLAGAFLVETEPAVDERGHFVRFFCTREFEQHGLDPRLAQCSVSHNIKRGTLRGMHYQAPPHQEAKTIRCLQGAVYDVIVDLRAGSPSYRRWYGVELSAAKGNALHVPAGFAHGFITLEDDTALEYLISTSYVPEAARGLRHDDPTLAIRWPLEPVCMSQRDRDFPLLRSTP